MTNRALQSVVLIVIAPLGIATWILATYTIGECFSPASATPIGFAMALLAAMSAGYVLLLSPPPEGANARFGIVLVICGTACVLVALALQFYLASLAGENSRRLSEILGDGVKRGERLNVNLNANIPESVKAVAYFALFAGIWLAAMGIHLGTARMQPTDAARSEEGIRNQAS